MNFGEKLTNLRKQKGLSQEELGYELNVTRQTISKWELGQTTPEMDKLVQMSKIFGVSLDELTSQTENTNSETQKIEDKPINDKPQNNSTLKVVLLIIVIFVIGGIIVYGLLFSKIFNFGKSVFDESKKIREKATGIINVVSGEIEQQMEGNGEIDEEFNQIKQNVLEIVDEAEKEINGTEENIKINQEKETEKQNANNESFNEKVEQIQQQVSEHMESAKEQMTPEQKELLEQAQQQQQQLLQQYQ